VNKVEVGFFSFTEITDPAEHRAYNEWHQLDHLPEQLPLRGVAYGQRWVATPACAAAALHADDALAETHYVTLYLMTQPVEQTLAEFLALGQRLRSLGRFHLHRRSHLSGPLQVLEASSAGRVLISPEAVPYRPNRGVYVQVQDVARVAPDLDAWCAVGGVAGAWTFANDERRVTVAWLDGAPLDVAAEIPPGPSDGVEFAGPFETITPWEWNWFD
jgi:hypothetical protein